MSFMQGYDERLKLAIYLICIFLIQFGAIYFINQSMLTNLNEGYIKQNIAIVGKIGTYDEKLVEKLIPIIIKLDYEYYDEGKEIMKEYSYSEDLEIEFNPLFYGIKKTVNNILILVCCTTLMLVLLGSIFILKPIFKEMKFLTDRAEKIVEGKFENKANEYGGSLDRFISKFMLMEDRIKNSIDLLKKEKINLKNIINDISHQLKTPLMAMTMYNDILVDHRDMEPEDVDDFINSNREQLDRMDWLVKTLLKYARLESNVVIYNKKMWSLKNTIEESIHPLMIKSEEKNQNLIFKFNKDVNYYHDREWIAEAVSNIVKNAIEHTDYNGEIVITLDETALSIIISIKDNGEGIEKSELKKIFKRFHKGENAVNPASIGIGLCLSKSIIRAHNGDITVESEVGVGSTFYITFLKTAKG